VRKKKINCGGAKSKSRNVILKNLSLQQYTPSMFFFKLFLFLPLSIKFFVRS